MFRTASDHSNNPFNLSGYRSWYEAIRPTQVVKHKFFLLDFETLIYSEEGMEGKKKKISGVEIYFITKQGERKRAFIQFDPYFYLLLENDDKKTINTVIGTVRSRGEERIQKVEVVNLGDSADILFYKKKKYLKVTVKTPTDVPALRNDFESIPGVIEWREADIQFHHRVAIDKGLRIGTWYNGTFRRGNLVELERIEDPSIPSLKVVAYDIEINSPQTRDPSVIKDQITMISIFTGIRNEVIVNSAIVNCKDIKKDMRVLLREKNEDNDLPWVDWEWGDDFETSKKRSTVLSSTPVVIHVAPTEKDLIVLFLRFLDQERPDIIADFYGDKFDLPFIIGRSNYHKIPFLRLTGFEIQWKMDARKKKEKEYLKDVESVKSVGVMHLDAWLWNEKYSYLPKKDQGLKQSVRKRVGIIPIGREALWNIEQDPIEAIAYNACDGYITLRYVKEIIIDFCISMGRMFPVPSCELLTVRAGTLDDLLVDSIGHSRSIVAKKRFVQKGIGKFSHNMYFKSIAYTGGAVGALNIGVWRSDLDYSISLNQSRIQKIIDLIPDLINNTADDFLSLTKKDGFEKQIEPLFPSEKDYLKYRKQTTVQNYFEVATQTLNRLLGKEQFIESKSILDKIHNYIESLILVDTERIISNVQDRLNQYIGVDLKTVRKLKGVHIDVTSMYPSQIRQFKIQPSGIVDPSYCKTCKRREHDDGCIFESSWIVKISAIKPCINKDENGQCGLTHEECSYEGENEEGCHKFSSGIAGNQKGFEFLAVNKTGKLEVYLYKNGSIEESSLSKSYFVQGFKNNEHTYQFFERWIAKNVEGALLNPGGIKKVAIASPSGVKYINPPKGMFLYLDIRKKNITIFVSVRSRICQKAYDFMSDIMDEFFKMRVFHKQEAKRLKGIIKTKRKSDERISAEMEIKRKFHDSTQLGLKVPLNSIYGLLGMKGGVHNASMPSAGITTSLSAKLILWGVKWIQGVGKVTEYDTDGIWAFIPHDFPLFFDLKIASKENPQELLFQQKFPFLEGIINLEISRTMVNPNFWRNDGVEIKKEPKCLITFEQDGPYDFQFIMGKKKYVVYNHNNEGKWIEKEVIGLETKRADFSQLVKGVQQNIIQAYLNDYGKGGSLKDLYQNACKAAEKFILSIREGTIAFESFIEPKSLTKSIPEYKGKLLPQVVGAQILESLGYKVEPGTRIDLLRVKTSSKKKSNSVVPFQLLSFPFKQVKKVLLKRGICTLAITMGEIQSMEDVKKHVFDYDSYVDDIISPNRIIHRMIIIPMYAQDIRVPIPKDIFSKDISATINGSMDMMDDFLDNYNDSVLDEVVDTPIQPINKTIINSHLSSTEIHPTELENKRISEKKDNANIQTAKIQLSAVGPLKTDYPINKKKVLPKIKKKRKLHYVFPLDHYYSQECGETVVQSQIHYKADQEVFLDDLSRISTQNLEIYFCPQCHRFFEYHHCNGETCPVDGTTVEFVFDIKQFLNQK